MSISDIKKQNKKQIHVPLSNFMFQIKEQHQEKKDLLYDYVNIETFKDAISLSATRWQQ